MTQITNIDLINNLRVGARLSNVEAAPTELSKAVVAVLDGTPDFHRVANVVRSGGFANATTVTLYTTSATRDFYLTNLQLNFIKDATSTATIVEVNAIIGAVSRALASLRTLTLTAHTENMSFNLPTPIRIDRNTAITLDGDSATGNISTRATLIGYEVDV